MRLEANISLAPKPSGPGPEGLPPYKVEVKNINSFRFFANAVETEITRHAEILDRGETPKQETRGYRDSTKSTVGQRSKEEAQDYRYFPDPDIPPIKVSDQWLDDIKQRLPVLPGALKAKLLEMGLAENSTDILIRNIPMYDYFIQVKNIAPNLVKNVANDLVNKKIDHNQMTPEEYVEQQLNRSANQIDEAELAATVTQVINENPKVAEDYISGKVNALGFLVGQVMRATGGKADPQLANKLLLAMLK